MKKPGLSSEDRILWGKVARSVRALPGRLEMLDGFEFDLPEEIVPEMPVGNPAKKIAAGGLDEVKASVRQKTPQHHPIERPVTRKIAKGRLPLEGRIDLHGLVQSEAHAMLHAFLHRAHEQGMRHVLVITGKGSSLGSDGALKRAVPMWFSKPEFRYLISGYETASRNHGGDGAIYVRLARKPGEKS